MACRNVSACNPVRTSTTTSAAPSVIVVFAVESSVGMLGDVGIAFQNPLCGLANNSLDLIERVHVEKHFRRCGSGLTDGDALLAVHPRISRMRGAKAWGSAHGGGGGCLAIEELFVTVRAQIHHAGVGELDQRAIVAFQRAPHVDEEDAVGPQRAEVSPSWLHAAL